LTFELPDKPCALYGEFTNKAGEVLRVQIVVTRRGQDDPPMRVWMSEQIDLPITVESKRE
jgi:hypothetical protein